MHIWTIRDSKAERNAQLTWGLGPIYLFVGVMTLKQPDRLVLCQQMEACIIQSRGSFMLFLFLSRRCRIWLQWKRRASYCLSSAFQRLSGTVCNNYRSPKRMGSNLSKLCIKKTQLMHEETSAVSVGLFLQKY